MSLLLPVLVFVVFTILTKGRFSTTRMILTTLRQSVVPALICYGIMLNMTVGMVNFSAGAAILSAGIIGGNLAQMTGMGIVGLVIFTVACGVVIGIVSGVLYIKMRVPAMVLTIGLMLVFEALPRIIFSNGINLSGDLTTLALSPYCFIIFGIMFLLFYLLYNKTAFGHNLRAIGSNQAISDSVGINSDKGKFMTFLLGGIFIGVAALIYTSNNGEVRPVAAMASMLIMMDGFMGMFMAMFISKYCNLAIAVPVSVLTMRLITNGFVALGMSATVRDITNGLVLLVLLAISANEGVFARIKANRAFADEANAEFEMANVKR
jgi:ribose transport system permease protein